MIMPRWAEPRRHTVVVVCVCKWVIPWESGFAYLHNREKLRTEMCNASLTQYYLQKRIGEFWIRGFVVELLCDLLTLTAVFHYPESFQDKAAHKKTAFKLDNTICTTRQTATVIISWERVCQRFTALAARLARVTEAWHLNTVTQKTALDSG